MDWWVGEGDRDGMVVKSEEGGVSDERKEVSGDGRVGR